MVREIELMIQVNVLSPELEVRNQTYLVQRRERVGWNKENIYIMMETYRDRTIHFVVPGPKSLFSRDGLCGGDRNIRTIAEEVERKQEHTGTVRYKT